MSAPARTRCLAAKSPGSRATAACARSFFIPQADKRRLRPDFPGVPFASGGGGSQSRNCMYQIDASSALGVPRAGGWRRARIIVGRTVLALGITSLVTDVSSEMVSTVLPIYLVF